MYNKILEALNEGHKLLAEGSLSPSQKRRLVKEMHLSTLYIKDEVVKLEEKKKVEKWVQKSKEEMDEKGTEGKFHKYASKHSGLTDKGTVSRAFASKIAKDKDLDTSTRREAQWFLNRNKE